MGRGVVDAQRHQRCPSPTPRIPPISPIRAASPSTTRRTSRLGRADRAEQAELAAPLGDLHEEVVGDVDRADRDDDERDQDEHEPDDEHHRRELLAERVLEPEVELVLQPLREQRELVLVLERHDDRRVGRRRFLAEELAVPALDVLDRHRHADRHRLAADADEHRLDAARPVLDRRVAAGDRRQAEADREPHRRQAAALGDELDEVGVGDRQAVRLRELAVVELDHRRRHHDRDAVVAALIDRRRSSTRRDPGTGCRRAARRRGRTSAGHRGRAAGRPDCLRTGAPAATG